MKLKWPKKKEKAKTKADLLDEELEREIAALDTFCAGTEEHTVAVEAIEKLYALRNAEDKTKSESKEAAKTRRSNLFGTIAGLAVPSVIYAWFFERSMRFEETGSYSESTTKETIKKLLERRHI